MKIVKLKNICDLDNGYAFKSGDYISVSNTLNCRMSNIRPDGSFDILYNAKYLPDEYAEKYKDYLLKDGDLIIAMTDMAGDPKILGVPTVVHTQGYNILLNQRVGRLRILDENIDVRYLKLALQNMKVRNYFKQFAGGGVQLNVSKKDILGVPIYLRSYEEQKYIADIFDEIIALIQETKQQVLNFETLIKSRFVEMFGDPVVNPKNWSVHQLSEYINFLTSGSRGWSQYFTDKGEYFITIKNVKNCRITLDDVQYVIPPKNAEAKRTKVQEGDLLISITADLGRTGVVTKEIAEYGGYINQHLTCIRVKKDKLNPLYAAYYMESEAGKCQFQSKNQSAVKAGLNFNSINSLKLMVPPLKLQNEFVSFVHLVDKSKLSVQKSLEELETLKNALMQKYFG